MALVTPSRSRDRWTRTGGRPTHPLVPVVLLALAGAATLVAAALPPAQRVVVVTAAQAAFFAASTAGLLWLRPARPAPWATILVGGVLYTAAWQLLRLGASTTVVVVLCCAAYASIVLLVRCLGGRRADHSGLEWFDVSLLAVAVAAATVHLPELLPPGVLPAVLADQTPTGDRSGAWVAVQSAGTTVMVALGLWVQAGGRRRDAGISLLLVAVAGLVAWHCWNLLLHLRGGYAPGALSDVLVVVGWGALAAAVWHPAHARLGRPSPTERPWVPSSIGTITACVVLGAVPALSVIGAVPLGGTALLVSSIGLAALLVARELVARRNAARAAGDDPLTGLGNRTALLRQVVRHLARPTAPGSLLCLVDVDDFARVNEHLGHQTGDVVLKELGRRLARETAGASAFRLAGDTFAVVVAASPAGEEVEHPVTSRLIRALAEPIAGSDHGAVVEVTVTIGEVVVAPLRPLDLDDPRAVDDEAVAVVQRAELALAQARRTGVRSCRATDDVVAGHQRQRRLVAELTGALARGEVVPHYQAQVDLRTRRPTGVEALARWEHPELGVISPAELLPVAEHLGVLDQVDGAVLRRSLQDLAAWRTAEPRLAHLRVAVNASAASLRRRDVVALVVEALTAAGLPGAALEVEITESASLDDRAGLEETLAELQDLGVAIAVDDFGSGYASMDYLVRFRADTIKVDRSLVRRVGSETGRRMLAALVDLTHDLGAQILAEGAEDDEAVRAVRALGFDLVQGYAHGLPGPAGHVPEALLAMLDELEPDEDGTPAPAAPDEGRASLRS
ncbi:MAG: diguanylate cyclase/phosphodiesterase (GGDEF & EAL domains) with PAS/PAC sensor(s) [uncultured Quadrisphaera sp.]|uniref:Diguanylate cyclase/phosphodiesterase (GGDEF & EAL domains) with PAS/PAC sensor(S) n=1 Tax=uncultured Quadrisphaera sp. TaxID=904978 RepID=A0A6J4PD31_9ACTN|nr:MAG: diguanylate cyclase/phosphodiesterase (GGDEF & EAL domains) with PAS/PAC sensor(s) [uncultured Quadrisphaera sp.]